jgi:hypothetical protein
LDHSDLVGEVLNDVEGSALQVESVAVRKQLLGAFDMEGRYVTAFRVDQVKTSGGRIHDHELSAVETSDETVGVETRHHLEVRHVDHFDHGGRGNAAPFVEDYLVQVGIDGVRAIHARPGDQAIVDENAIAESDLHDKVAAAGIIDNHALIPIASGAKGGGVACCCIEIIGARIIG